MQRKGTRVNPALGDQSGIPISRLRAKANKRRGDYIAARRKTKTLPGGRIVSLNVLPHNHRKLDWSDGVQQGPATVTLLTPPVPTSLAGATLWPTGGAFVSGVIKAGPLRFDGGAVKPVGRYEPDGNLGGATPFVSPIIVDGGKAA